MSVIIIYNAFSQMSMGFIENYIKIVSLYIIALVDLYIMTIIGSKHTKNKC